MTTKIELKETPAIKPVEYPALFETGAGAVFLFINEITGTCIHTTAASSYVLGEQASRNRDNYNLIALPITITFTP